MRIKRTDQNFTVRQKAGRKIHYAGQGKGHTENTAHFSPEEKQGALRQKNFSTKDTGIQAKAQIQIQSGTGRDAGDLFADKTAESYQQGYGSSTGRNGSKFGDPAVLGNLHVKRPLQEYRKESVPNEKPPAGSSQISQRQYQGEQIHRPSSYHEKAGSPPETECTARYRQDGDFQPERKQEKKESGTGFRIIRRIQSI